MKKIVILLLSFAIIIFIVHSCDYRLWMLKKRTLTYSELPQRVREYITSIPPCDPHFETCLFVDNEERQNYQLKVKKTIVGPWIRCYKLTNIKKNITYTIERKTPSPFLIYCNKLYVPNQYDIFCGVNIKKVIYTEYELK